MVELFRYYTLMRPPMPGAIPKGCYAVVSFERRTYVDEIGREAWGYVEYRQPLTDNEIADYELMAGGVCGRIDV